MGLFQKSLTGIKNSFLFRVSMNPQKDWKAKLERPHFFKVQPGKIQVCLCRESVKPRDNLCQQSAHTPANFAKRRQRLTRIENSFHLSKQCPILLKFQGIPKKCNDQIFTVIKIVILLLKSVRREKTHLHSYFFKLSPKLCSHFELCFVFFRHFISST